VSEEHIRAASHREDLAWAAGLYDGEGSTGCYIKKRPAGRVDSVQFRVTVGQHHDPEVLHRFVGAVGMGKVYGPYRHPSGERFAFQAAGTKAVLVIETILPWLSGPKRRQAEAALVLYRKRSQNSRQGRICPPDCTCGRHNRYSTDGLTEQQLRRREKMREYQKRHREKVKAAQCA
jgi:hypothetical protein